MIVTRRMIAITLLLIWLLIIGYAIFGVQLKENSVTYNINRYLPDANGNDAVYASTRIVFSTQGSFSADNLIHVDLRLVERGSDLNLPRYCCLYFTDSAFPNGTAIHPALLLTTDGTGAYVARADMVWEKEVDAYVFLGFGNGGAALIDKIKNSTNYSPVLHISGLQDTLNNRFNLSIERLTLVVAAFSVLLIQPVAEAVLIKEPRNRQTETSAVKNSPKNQVEDPQLPSVHRQLPSAPPLENVPPAESPPRNLPIPSSSSEVRFCSICGNQVGTGARFCNRCGKNIR